MTGEQDNAPRLHFVGVAGVGMSALAQAVLSQGYAVSGSDRDRDQGKNLPIFDQLTGAGVEFYPQDGSGVVKGLVGVVISTAIEDDNPEVMRARELGVAVVHRAEMLARLLEGKRCAAVTGTSGKSTVTGMVGWILEQAGADPTVVNGAPVVNWHDSDRVGNFRKGGSDLWVIEADESDRSLLSFEPDWGVVTNVSEDHFDRSETEDLFKQFTSRVRNEVVQGLDPSDLIGSVEVAESGVGSTFCYRDTEFRVPLLGMHNVENALYAVVLCHLLGCSLEDIRDALASFGGIHRRLEVAGEKRGAKVIDDYAHNPAKIAASLAAARPTDGCLFVVWRPHGYGPLRTMMDGLIEVFSSGLRAQDSLFVLPVYDAGGTADRSADSVEFVSRFGDKAVSVSGCDGYDDVTDTVVGAVKEGDTVLVMGARDPELPALARKILLAL